MHEVSIDMLSLMSELLHGVRECLAWHKHKHHAFHFQKCGVEKFSIKLWTLSRMLLL